MLSPLKRIEKLSLNNLRYNPELGGFEADAELIERGHVYLYAVRVLGTPHIPFERVTQGLVEHAYRAHRLAPSTKPMSFTRVPFEAPTALAA